MEAAVRMEPCPARRGLAPTHQQRSGRPRPGRPRAAAPELRQTLTDEAIVYEYAVLVTSLHNEILTVAQLYRGRADCENPFDELKNHWGWGGFTTHDMKRCRFMARIAALVYN